MVDREDEIKSKIVTCKDCGVTGIAYDENGWDEDTRYWDTQGMWGRAETETSKCGDCYPLSWKNLSVRAGSEDVLRALLEPAFQQAMQLREMGLSSSEANEVVFNAMDTRNE